MARQRQKAHPFTIWADTGIPTPEAEGQPSFEETLAVQAIYGHSGDSEVRTYEPIEDEDIWEDQEDTIEQVPRGHHSLVNNDEDNEDDDERRESGLARTSISSLPESEYRAEIALPVRSPQIIRPSFMRPESVRRMQMASPPPFNSRSSRTSVQRLNRSRPGTPRSVRSANARGSPKPRRLVSEDSEDEEAHYPLVLLHVTILPVHLPWSAESMHEFLPKTTMANLHLLKAKVSETIFQRGILIPHPREEYELLEERLLEALELTQERVTKCGHFRNRSSTSSGLSFDSGRESDSAMGSSIDFPIGEQCGTCSSPIKDSRLGAGTTQSRWTVKVFAANGLMRTAAWGAAWSEMESVDVEILPWISEEMRITLDERREEEEEIEMKVREEAEQAAIRERAEDHAFLIEEREKLTPRPASAISAPLTIEDSGESQPRQVPKEPAADLPQIYRKADIPLSVLLRNYIFLLAQDRRNVAAVFIALLSIVYMLQPSAHLPTGVVPASTSAYTESGSVLEMTKIQPMVPTDLAGETSPVEVIMAAETEAIDSSVTESALSWDPESVGKELDDQAVLDQTISENPIATQPQDEEAPKPPAAEVPQDTDE